jgi:signal transduction histidine kinase
MMNAATGAASMRQAQEPLGTLLVKRGLISDEQLAVALAEQQSSGQPLGKIVVQRGFVRPEVIAQALATQHGGLLKTEYGFATGFGAGEAPQEPVSAPPVSIVPAKRPSALRNELAHASDEVERLREENDRLVGLRANLEQRVAAESQRAASLERELESRGAGDPAALAELEEKLAALEDMTATLEADLAARDATISQFNETADSWRKALDERDDAIHSLVAARDEALKQVAEFAHLRVALEMRDNAICELVMKLEDAIASAPKPARFAEANRHVLFVRDADGYSVVERDGPPPFVGDVVHVHDRAATVTRVGVAPDGSPCAYLLA